MKNDNNYAEFDFRIKKIKHTIDDIRTNLEDLKTEKMVFSNRSLEDQIKPELFSKNYKNNGTIKLRNGKSKEIYSNYFEIEDYEKINTEALLSSELSNQSNFEKLDIIKNKPKSENSSSAKTLNKNSPIRIVDESNLVLKDNQISMQRENGKLSDNPSQNNRSISPLKLYHKYQNPSHKINHLEKSDKVIYPQYLISHQITDYVFFFLL